MTRHKFRVSDPVSYFGTDNQLKEGFIASIRGGVAEIITENGSEYRTHVYALRLRNGVKPKRVYTENQLKKSQFLNGDEVQFTNPNETKLSGTIVRMNPQFAIVLADDQHWNVPYSKLVPVGSSRYGHENRKRLDAIASQADELIQHHNLDDWRFNFDYANRRLGQCSYAEKTITMSEQFCLNASDDDIKDTILHEIAHALVGPEHGHDQMWYSKAREIGCSGERLHGANFTSPKYIMSCRNCGWFTGRYARRNLICKHCQTPVTYENYSPERWNSLSAQTNS